MLGFICIDGQFDASGFEILEDFGNIGIGLGLRMGQVNGILSVFGGELIEFFAVEVASPLTEVVGTMSDSVEGFVGLMCGEAPGLEGLIECGGNIVKGIEEGAVHVPDDGFGECC